MARSFVVGVGVVVRLLPLFLTVFGAVVAKAEPWLAIRFAQHCAACHAPGRINLPPKDRRCTLSCQGCHVNPNGGGLRSFYGKWNENRLLRSFVIDALKPDPSFAPVSKQRYHKSVPETERNKKFIRDVGHPLIAGEKPIMDDEVPFLRDGREFTTAENKFRFLEQIPQNDPYRLYSLSKIDGGVDLRYQFVRLLSDSNEERFEKRKKTHLFMMNADFALRWRPVYRKLHFVYETRFMGGPEQEEFAKFWDRSSTRSLYVMVDDLPYNVFVMYGLYRPLFGGNPMPDHTALPQRLTAKALGENSAYAIRYRAFSIGTAPNVPYANIHLIQRKSNRFSFADDDSTKGGALNLGLRFVTLGINVTYSFWWTQDDVDNKSILHSASYGMQLYRTTLLFELFRLHRTTARREDTGNVVSFDSHTQLWRHIYLTAQYAWANVSKNFTAGSSQQYRVGLRGFLLPGVDLSLTYEFDIDVGDDDVQNKISSLTSQVHVSM